MNTNLKIGFALALLVAAVIGATVITQFSESEPEQKPLGLIGAGFSGGMPLAFKDANLFYDPKADAYAMREFPGFFEVNKEVHWATYLLRNPHAVPVQLTARWRSCAACSQLRVAVLTADESRAMRRDVGVSAAVGGLLPDPEVGLYRRAEASTLVWQPMDFDKPDEFLVVPPAVDPATPTWCVLQLGFEVKQNGPKTLEAQVGMQAQGMRTPAVQPFNVSFYGDSAERVSPAFHDFGVIGEASDPKTIDLYYWSTTRPQSAFAPPKAGGLEGDPFFTATAPVPLSAADLDVLARRASSEKMPVRARGGYKFTVTLRRSATTPDGPRELDIGPVERNITVGASDGTTSGQTVQLSAMVTGLVALADGDAVNLGDFRGRVKTEREFKLTSGRLNLDLEPANDGGATPRDRNPPGVTVTPVGPPVVENGQKRWTFKMTIAADAFGGAVNGQLIVFRAKGTSQMIRIPLKGTANSR